MRAVAEVDERGAPFLEIFAISLASIVLEIGYTRIFSFKLYYYFTYLIIGLALLGLGAGGVFVTLIERLRDAPLGRVLARGCVLAGASALLGYLVVARVPLDPSQLDKRLLELAKLALLSTVVFLPFLFTGVMITRMFSAHPERIARLYCADLAGAALGCAVIIPLIWTATPPGCVMASGALFALAGLRRATRDARGVMPWIALVSALGVVGAMAPRVLPDPVPEPQKTLGNYDPALDPVVFSQWSPVFRIDVMETPWRPDVKLVIHDGQLGSGLHRFDGDLSHQTQFEADPRTFPFAVARKDPRVLVIGAAGGHELLASLYFGAAHVTGIELNPATVSLLTDHFADFTGHLPDNPRVTLINAEGRSFLKRTGGTYDLIWLVAPDTYAAMNAASSAAYVLSEGYLYTVEMIDEVLAHLSDDGVLCAQFGETAYAQKPNRTTRYVSTAREALRRLGVDDFGRHVVVLTSPDVLMLSTILVKRTPFTEEELARLTARFARVPGTEPRWVPGRRPEEGPVTTAITAPEGSLPAWYRERPYLVDPVTDDSPFFWHFARFRDALRSARSRGVTLLDPEDSTGERVLFVLLAFVVVFAAVMLLLPFRLLGARWRRVPGKGWAALYFAAIGTGFMFLEVPLIQRLTLFLGYPSYSLSVTLCALLLSTGFGSMLSARYPSTWRVPVALLAVIAACVAFYRLLWPMAVGRLVGLALPWRVLAAVVIVAPLGVALGAFMPLGLVRVARVGEVSREYVAWAWAVNGFFSVISSVLSTILAMVIGFDAIMATALGLYVLAVLALTRLSVSERPTPSG
jgi:spermidine synthase